MVKILTRLYDPTDGTMLLDGVDIADVDANLWQQRVTGAFQDFLRPYLTMRQAVGIGSPATMDDSRVTDSLLKAGMQPVVANLEAGLDTQLGRSFDGGVELSGGQWQKVAIGRGFMPDAPLLVLLDEPTASLDAQSEEAIYRSFAQRAVLGGRPRRDHRPRVSPILDRALGGSDLGTGRGHDGGVGNAHRAPRAWRALRDLVRSACEAVRGGLSVRLPSRARG